MKFRPASINDADALCSIAQASFGDGYIDKMIYGCDGIARYLECCISQGGEISDTAIYVCEHKGKICGFAHFKKDFFRNFVFLNYICIDQELRGKNLGSRLLAYSLSQVQVRFKVVRLDVFATNTTALKWYSSLGFALSGEKYWKLKNLTDRGDEYGCFSGLPHAAVSQSAYGFSQVSLSTNLNSYAIGMLGVGYFRVFDARITDDGAALSSLARLDSRRKLLLISDSAGNDGQDLVVFDKSINMSASRASILNKLTFLHNKSE